MTAQRLCMEPIYPAPKGRRLAHELLCSVRDFVIHGYGGVGNLEDLIRTFVDWADSQNPQAGSQ
jgi:hypothetical protein